MKIRDATTVLLALILSGCASVNQQPSAIQQTPAVKADLFIGKWLEYWPDIPQHATHTVTKRGDDYQIVGASPLTQQYAIASVRIDGDWLKFSEGTATLVVDYELRVRDSQTLSVRAKGRSGWREDIVWKRSQ